jgi:hypothetical protein
MELEEEMYFSCRAFYLPGEGATWFGLVFIYLLLLLLVLKKMSVGPI